MAKIMRKYESTRRTITNAGNKAEELIDILWKNNQGNWEHGFKDQYVCKLGKNSRHGVGGKARVQINNKLDMKSGPKFTYSSEDWSHWKGLDMKITPVHPWLRQQPATVLGNKANVSQIIEE